MECDPCAKRVPDVRGFTTDINDLLSGLPEMNFLCAALAMTWEVDRNDVGCAASKLLGEQCASAIPYFFRLCETMQQDDFFESVGRPYGAVCKHASTSVHEVKVRVASLRSTFSKTATSCAPGTVHLPSKTNVGTAVIPSSPANDKSLSTSTRPSSDAR